MAHSIDDLDPAGTLAAAESALVERRRAQVTEPLLEGGGVTRRPHHRAVVHLHLHESALTGSDDSVARVEGLGPMLTEQVVGLLGHAHVTVRPVLDLDLDDQVSVNAYEFPTEISERARLRNVGDVFPHATSAATMTGRYDDDHVVPYDAAGPPGQTGDLNIAPLGRSHHRAKTHRGHRVRQIDAVTYLWTTPHGLQRLVDPTGTHPIDELDAWRVEHADRLQAVLARPEPAQRTG